MPIFIPVQKDKFVGAQVSVQQGNVIPWHKLHKD